MPSSVAGFTRDEAISQIQDIVGNNSATFLSVLQTNITAWQYEFLGLNDWSFLMRTGIHDGNVFFTVALQSNYTLNTATLGVEMNVTNVESLYIQNAGSARKLTKISTIELENFDPGQEAPAGKPYYWIPSGRQKIVLYPTPSGIETVGVDGKIHGAELHTNITLPIPYQYQDLFIQWCLCKSLRRERDPRAAEEYRIFQGSLRAAIADDKRELQSDARMKFQDELDGPNSEGTFDQRVWLD